MDLNFTDVSGKCPIKQDAVQLGFLTVLGAVSKTREIKIRDHEESGQVSLGHKQKRNPAGDMSVPSVKDACGYQAASNHMLDSENSPRRGPGQGRVTDNLCPLQNSGWKCFVAGKCPSPLPLPSDSGQDWWPCRGEDMGTCCTEILEEAADDQAISLFGSIFFGCVPLQ